MANHRRYRYAEAEALTTRRSPLTGTCKTQSPGGQVGSARRSARVFAVIGTGPRLFFDARGLRKRDSAGFVEALAHALHEVNELAPSGDPE